MNSIFNIHSDHSTPDRLQKYYRFHAQIYDITRWSFLFGRDNLLKMVSDVQTPSRILEIGCGTGHMLKRFHQQFPSAHITGIDISKEMLSVAEQKLSEVNNVSLKHQKYGPDNPINDSFDLIILSYSLTMIDTNLQQVIYHLKSNLAADGIIAAVDFHSTPFSGFKRWMQLNHVTLSGNILSLLNASFEPIKVKKKSAYFGLWSYYQFVGKNT